MVGKKVLITAALPYINNVPHLGHIVGSHLPADIFHRFCVSYGYDATFVGGSDEHGTPSVLASKELGIPTRTLVDRLHEVHRRVYERLSISYDNYSRTSNPSHHEVVKDFFETVQSRGYINSGSVSMYYCEKDRLFLPDRFVIGTCPHCGKPANADQCESCTALINPGELVDPHCKSCNNPSVVRDSNDLYFDLPDQATNLESWIATKRSVWRPHVHSEAMRWINGGLKSRSITRDLEWGIKVPGQENKVFYVWFDAPIAYMTFTQELGRFEDYWKDPDARIFHFLGKDNIPFHTIFWPAMLMAHGNLNLPTNVVGYNYLNFEGQKFSKSKGVGIFCYNLLNSPIQVDVLRSYLTTIIPENKDSEFQWDSFVNFTNSELIGKLGNFFNRVLNLVYKNFSGRLGVNELSGVNDLDTEVVRAIQTKPGEIAALYERTEFREAYRRVMDLASDGNAYLSNTEPWRLIKEGRIDEAKKVLAISLNLCRTLAIAAYPVLPNTMSDFWTNQLNLPGGPGDSGRWHESNQLIFNSDHVTNTPVPLYLRIDASALEGLKRDLSQPYSLESLVCDTHGG
jgi:methionyl-tRNA synthetase